MDFLHNTFHAKAIFEYLSFRTRGACNDPTLYRLKEVVEDLCAIFFNHTKL